MDLKEIGINTRFWINSAQDRNYWRALVFAVLNLWFLQTIKLGTPTGKIPLGRPRHRCEDNIR